ncbi:hypothetical protein PL335_16720 (plasmid) [Sulfitobacter faviae]|uniref:hypothetical protein n=1 Tax=Sulfitobacter faviae TaxID=1775881 RepID=UPI002307D4D8|nr:hypothetical protein [Sulfitobacter faviae]WCE68619.1 hypothetical protein PL335_16720 [Sulfitobacter faviae]
MGMDMGFIKVDSQEEVASLRNHWALAESIFDLAPPTYNDGYSDLVIEDWVIEEVSERWDVHDTEVKHAEAALSETEFERVCDSSEDEHDFSVLRPVYRRLLKRLYDAASGPDLLVCYWSA